MGDLPTISLFSGVGGLDFWAERAGFDVRVALEFERDSAASLRANHFPDEPGRVIERSIVEVPTDELLSVAGLEPGQAALVIGGPPCTPIARAGRLALRRPKPGWGYAFDVHFGFSRPALDQAALPSVRRARRTSRRG